MDAGAGAAHSSEVAMLASLIFGCALLLLGSSTANAAPETVYFRSADGATEIVGYVFKPTVPGPYPAIVMLHSRAGAYSSNSNAG
jgi:hypothetical protein